MVAKLGMEILDAIASSIEDICAAHELVVEPETLKIAFEVVSLEGVRSHMSSFPDEQRSPSIPPCAAAAAGEGSPDPMAFAAGAACQAFLTSYAIGSAVRFGMDSLGNHAESIMELLTALQNGVRADLSNTGPFSNVWPSPAPEPEQE